jgi:hypothetical protein
MKLMIPNIFFIQFSNLISSIDQIGITFDMHAKIHLICKK